MDPNFRPKGFFKPLGLPAWLTAKVDSLFFVAETKHKTRISSILFFVGQTKSEDYDIFVGVSCITGRNTKTRISSSFFQIKFSEVGPLVNNLVLAYVCFEISKTRAQCPKHKQTIAFVYVQEQKPLGGAFEEKDKRVCLSLNSNMQSWSSCLSCVQELFIEAPYVCLL